MRSYVSECQQDEANVAQSSVISKKLLIFTKTASQIRGTTVIKPKQTTDVFGLVRARTRTRTIYVREV